MTKRLLPILFALAALMLSLHQASAADRLEAYEHHGIHLSHVEAHDVDHPIHSTSCCTLTFGIAAPVFVSFFYDAPASEFAFHTDTVPPYPHLRAEHFRPPRLA